MILRPAQSLGLRENPVCLKTERKTSSYFGESTASPFMKGSPSIRQFTSKHQKDLCSLKYLHVS